VVQSFAVARIRYFELARRSGWSAGLNMAINEAKGKYIAYLDDDDVYYPDHLEGMVSALERSHCKVIYNNNKAVGGKFEHGRFIPQRVFVREPVKFSRERLLHKGWFGNNNIMHHKSVFKDVGLFDDDLWAAEDWDMWLRMALRFDFDYVDATTTECRGRGDNISMKNRDEVLFFDIIVGNFYRYYMGKIAYVKHFLARSQEKEAYSLYDEISAGYENYFRTPELMRELIDFARHFGDTRFLMRLSRDYFSAGPRRWKKEALSHRPFEMILGALPAVPLKVFEKLRRCYPARRSAADLGNG
jgi:glycosyltransferase involved in cell wall biosynthesis